MKSAGSDAIQKRQRTPTSRHIEKAQPDARVVYGVSDIGVGDRRNLYHSGLPEESDAAALQELLDQNDLFDEPPEWLLAESQRRRER